MTNEEIQLIEERTGITLPDSYKEIVMNYPEELRGTEAEDYGLINEPKSIIAENLNVRENGYFGESWPERYFIIGLNGCGDYYVINHQNKDFSVGFACHEKMSCDPFASNLTEFVKKYLSEIN